jgi:hypothetical protein
MTDALWPRAVTVMMALAALALLMIPTAAHADAPDESGVVERAPQFSGWLFWDGDGLIVTTGPTPEEGCVGEGFQFPIATTVNPPGGATVSRYTHSDEVWVYDDEGTSDPLEWLFGRLCAAVTAGEPVPEPLARGEGRVTEANGNITVTARVTTADGRTAHLNVVGADFGEFPDFINYGG